MLFECKETWKLCATSIQQCMYRLWYISRPDGFYFILINFPSLDTNNYIAIFVFLYQMMCITSIAIIFSLTSLKMPYQVGIPTHMHTVHYTQWICHIFFHQFKKENDINSKDTQLEVFTYNFRAKGNKQIEKIEIAYKLVWIGLEQFQCGKHVYETTLSAFCNNHRNIK